MRAKVTGLHRDIPDLANPSRCAQHVQFSLFIQAVTRFDLNSRDALSNQRISAGQGAGDKVI